MRFEKTIGYIKELTEKIRSEMQLIPRTINPQNVGESIEIALKFLNALVRIKVAIKITEAAETLDIPPRDKIQIRYYSEVLKEYLVSIYNSSVRILEAFKKVFSEESFEQIMFNELEVTIKEVVRPHLPTELVESKQRSNTG